MIWARRILISISVVVAIFALAVVLLVTIDLGRFKGNVQDYVSEKTGRQLLIAGIFQPSIGRTVDFGTEAMDVSFRVKQREGIGVSVAGIVNPDGS